MRRFSDDETEATTPISEVRCSTRLPPCVLPAPLVYEEASLRYSGEIERRIRESKGSGIIGEMIDYHLEAGGKRIRALLPVWVCHNLGGRAEEAIDLGAGLELLHNATLVHDDIQDGDTHRRGRPTVWHKWGMPQAINAGDALIFTAFTRIARAKAAPRLMGPIAEALVRLVEGQAREFQFQLSGEQRWAIAPTLPEWEKMARGKTGALFAACMRAGAAAAEVNDALVESAAQYGEDVGLLFQVQDDYLDLVGDKGREQRASDLMEGKLSFPVVWAYEHGDPAVIAPLRATLGRKREERTWAMVEDALQALHRSFAIDATGTWLRDAAKAASEHPMARAVPGWAERCLAPVAHALGFRAF
jgi:geranylgeranyl diphosphate synthase type I